MKKHSGTILLVLIFFVGLAVMLYPTISDYINQRNQTRVVNSYAQQVDGLSDADYTAYFDAADVFNQKIAADPDALYHADRFSTYSTTLDVTGTGIMGYITIPRIGVELPIYHGTSDAVLQVAAGHLEGTSLPVGGESTHAVISAHRGLPSAKLFTNLDQGHLAKDQNHNGQHEGGHRRAPLRVQQAGEQHCANGCCGNVDDIVADEDGGEQLVVLFRHSQHAGCCRIAVLSTAFQADLVQGRKCGLRGGEKGGKCHQNDQRH